MPNLSLGKSIALTDLSTEVNRYRHVTPGIFVCVHFPILLDDRDPIVPGLVAMVGHGRLKQCKPSPEGVVGPPNFVLDVIDFGEEQEYEERRAAFEGLRVGEYVTVHLAEEQRCVWNRLEGERFVEVEPDGDGTMKSKALPGLWFSTGRSGDGGHWWLKDRIEYGATRLGHHELMETIWHKEGRDPDWGDWMPFDAG